MKKLLKKIPKIHWFDAVIGITVVVVLVGFFLFFYRRAQYIDIRVKVTDQEVLSAYREPRNIYAWQFHVGDFERDVIGRIVTEITNVESFSVTPETKTVYLTLRVRATYDTRTQTYSARGKTLMYGTPMRFNLNNVTFDGFVIDAPNIVKLNVEDRMVRVKTIGRGVEPSLARKIKVGDAMYDSHGNVIMKVTDVKVTQAKQITEDYLGNFHVRYNPLYQDIAMEMEVAVKRVNGKDIVMLDNYRVSINAGLPFTTETYSIYPMIEDIELL
ncbi:hypothetical protein H3C66_00530 [Patescibacteria group bacterium]|nr:hypothetical protein [Patescibacteria group bacterium]